MKALFSVFNKEGILPLASYLMEAGWEIISTGGTSKHLRDNKIPVTDVSALTGFPECLDGRVKTLHPAIHAGLLARRELESHIKTLKELKLETIDLVCVNLYPFFEKIQAVNSGSAVLSLDETIEFIDIGGPAMLRSAAKNFKDVVVLTDPADYPETIDKLKAGKADTQFRKRLAGKVFSLTSAYDAAIARFLLELEGASPEPSPVVSGREDFNAASLYAEENENKKNEYPSFWPLSLKKAQELRYGENGHQQAALYFNTSCPGALAGMEQLHGKELGYNNIRDLDLAWKAACTFGLASDGTPPMGEAELKRLVPGAAGRGLKICCTAVKHNTPCGIALGDTLLEAYEKTFACDPVSIFGGIIASTATIDASTATKLSELFLEIIIAPDFETEALEILKKKKNLRLMKAAHAPRDTRECIAVDGGLLVQDTDKKLIEKWEQVTKAAPVAEDIPDLVFGMRAVGFVKSNAIMVIKDLAATGIGGGQVNRIWPTMQALERSTAAITAAGSRDGPWKDSKCARVLASDAFIPFPDVIEAAAEAGIKSIIQPGGSVNDKAAIEACDRLNLAMVFTGIRHFKH